MDTSTITAVLGAMGWGAYVPVALAAIGLTAHVAAVLPVASPTSPSWWRVSRRVLDVLSGNYGSATNAADRPVAPAPAVP